MQGNRRLGWVAAASGIALSLSLTGALEALPTAAVQSDGNRLESGRYTGGLLRLALVGDAGDCPTATLTTDPLPPLLLGDVDLDDLAWQQMSGVLCIEQHDENPRSLLSLVEPVVDAERGHCLLAEIASGDPSCGDGEDGELDDVVVLAFEPAAPGGCGAATASFTAMRDGVELVASLPPATRCALRLVASIDPHAPRDARGRAAGDELEWRQILGLGDPAEDHAASAEQRHA